jgi:hypothetical protein
MANRFQHRAIGNGITVGIATAEIQVILRSEGMQGTKFGLANHLRSGQFAGPSRGILIYPKNSDRIVGSVR